MARIISRGTTAPRKATTDRALDDFRIFDNIKHKNIVRYDYKDRRDYRRAVRRTRRTGKMAVKAAYAAGIDL